MARITDIRRSGPALRRRTLVLDGDTWRDVPARVVASLALSVDDEVERDELGDRITAAERPLARERALRLLNAKERSRAGLLARLIDDGFSQPVAAETVVDFERMGLVDDERFAHALARTMAHARGIGRSGIARELRSAGIDEETAADALDEALGADDESVAARRIADAAAARPGATVEKIAARLARRGYRLPLALGVAREAVAALGRPDAGEPDREPPFDD